MSFRKDSEGKAREQGAQQRRLSVGDVPGPRDASCLSCNALNENEARFCAECGSSMQAEYACERCSAAIGAGADICEGCGAWLLQGQCVFCYAPIDEEDTFCSLCGNPKDGVTCPKCGTAGIFDFCRSCGAALTAQAESNQKDAAQMPGLQDLVALFKQIDPAAEGTATRTIEQAFAEPHAKSADNQIAKMRAIRTSMMATVASRPTPERASLLTESQKARVDLLQNSVSSEIDRRERTRQEADRRREEAARKRRELFERARQELARHSGKTFSDNQEARRFFMSLIAAMPKELADELVQRGLSWRCNAFNCVHSAPHECADPSQGGVWLVA